MILHTHIFKTLITPHDNLVHSAHYSSAQYTWLISKDDKVYAFMLWCRQIRILNYIV